MKTRKQLNESSENLNISDVSDNKSSNGMEKIDQILDSLYDRVIEPIEAKEQLLLLFGVSGRSEQLPTRYKPCGGCGAENPNERCFNCFHDFGGN